MSGQQRRASWRMNAGCMALLRAALLLAAWATTYAAGAADAPLHGTYRIGGKTLVDPPPDEPLDSHLYVELTGRAARDVYVALAAPARPDACGGKGALVKRSGGIACTRAADGREHRCTFGVDLRGARIVNGSVC